MRRCPSLTNMPTFYIFYYDVRNIKLEYISDAYLDIHFSQNVELRLTNVSSTIFMHLSFVMSNNIEIYNLHDIKILKYLNCENLAINLTIYQYY